MQHLDGLPKSIALQILSQKFSRVYGLDFIIEGAMDGYQDAIEKFNPDKGAKFNTYATIRIRGGIFDLVRKNSDISRLDTRRKKNFEIKDEGWKAYPGGYFDRKVQVTMPGGRNAELQIFSREIGNAKDGLHEIYQKARELQNRPEQKTEYQKLLDQSDKVAAAALAAGADTWQGIYDQIGLTVPGL